MNRQIKGSLAVAGAVVIGLSLFAAGTGAKSKIPRLGTSTEVETSTLAKNNRSLTVTALVESSAPRCERQRSVLLFEAGPTGELAGGAIGHGVTQGGAQQGQVTIEGIPVKKVTPTRRFILETVGRKVKINGKETICKRGVSASFLANFNPTPTS